MKFISIISHSDPHFKALCDNFLHTLKAVGLEAQHELLRFDDEAGVFNSPQFNKMVFKKLALTHKFLKEGHIVWVSDIDIVYFKNPKAHLLSLLEDNLLVGQTEPDGRINTGFYMVRPHELTISLFDPNIKVKLPGHDHLDDGLYYPSYGEDKRAATPERVKPFLKEGDGHPDLTDQGYLNHKLLRNEYSLLREKTSPWTIHRLSSEDFPVGLKWYEEHLTIKDPYLIHYNWIPNSPEKIQRMKEYNHWYI